MNNITEALTKFQASDLQCISSSSGIFKVLLECKDRGSIVGIRTDSHPATISLIAVQDIILDDEDSLAVVTRFENSGPATKHESVELLNIQAVYIATQKMD